MQEPSGQVTAPALQALLTGGALAGEWALDPRKSSIQLKSRAMWGLAPVNGVFRQVTGKGTVSAAGKVGGTVTVAAASIDTKNTWRDTHLRSADFFDTGTYPDLSVTVDGIRPSGRGVAVTGALTVRGVTRLPGCRRAAVQHRNQRRPARVPCPQRAAASSSTGNPRPAATAPAC